MEIFVRNFGNCMENITVAYPKLSVCVVEQLFKYHLLNVW
jgi:hypothetical protein